MTRAQESARAMKLQELLGEGYEVRYDDCESCKTRFFFMGTYYKEIDNSEISKPGLSISEYAAPMQLKMAKLYGC